MTIRDALAVDAKAIREVASMAWRYTYVGLLTKTTIEAFIESAYAIDRLERRIERHTFLVAEDHAQVVAFADALAEADRLTLAAIYVMPERRRRGAGTMLLDAIRSRFPDLPVAADVLVGNRKGEGFYKRRGFVPLGTLEAELFGEHVVERRWWLGEPRTATD